MTSKDVQAKKTFITAAIWRVIFNEILSSPVAVFHKEGRGLMETLEAQVLGQYCHGRVSRTWDRFCRFRAHAGQFLQDLFPYPDKNPDGWDDKNQVELAKHLVLIFGRLSSQPGDVALMGNFERIVAAAVHLAARIAGSRALYMLSLDGRVRSRTTYGLRFKPSAMELVVDFRDEDSDDASVVMCVRPALLRLGTIEGDSTSTVKDTLIKVRVAV